MKKWRGILFTGMAAFALAACGNDGATQPNTPNEGESLSSESMSVSSQESSVQESVSKESSSESLNTSESSESAVSSQSSKTDGEMTFAISMKDAIDIYLKEFPNAQIKEIEFEKEDGRWIYEIDGAWDNRKHELEIDAENGDIVDRDEDSMHENARYLNIDKLIDAEEAVKAAKQEIGGNLELEDWELEVETHNGEEIPVFEVEFTNDSREVEVHGETGEILGVDD